MPILKNTKTESINPFAITLLFPNDKPYPWRTESDLTIDPNDETNPLHHLYDDRVLNAVNTDTVNNVAEFGVRQAVTLIEREGKVFKVDGLGRIKAARLASKANAEKGLPEVMVPYVKSAEKDDGILAALSISLNTHREDDAPLKKAKLASLLMGRYNWTPQQAANYFKVSITAIKQWLGVVENATPAVLKAIEKGKIAFTTGANYAKMPAEEQETALNKDLEAIEGRTQVRSGEEKRLSGSEIGKAKAQLTQEQKDEKAFQKVCDLMEALSPENRLRVFALYDTATGEEKAIYQEVEDDEAEAVDADDDSKELAYEYDDVTIEADNAPTVKRRKAASKPAKKK